MQFFGIPLSGIRTAIFRQSVTANNLANVITPGFKTTRAEQQESVGGGVQISATRIIFSQGPIEITNLPVDMSVNGDGFFVLQTPQGIKYTRAGQFKIDANGNLVDSNGNILQPSIQVPREATSINITPQGQVYALFSDGNIQQIGQLNLARFRNPGGLRSEGDNLFSQTAASGEAIIGTAQQGSYGSIVFGSLESSNVDLTGELVNTILNRGILAANVKVIKSKDEMLGTIVDIRR